MISDEGKYCEIMQLAKKKMDHYKEDPENNISSGIQAQILRNSILHAYYGIGTSTKIRPLPKDLQDLLEERRKLKQEIKDGSEDDLTATNIQLMKLKQTINQYYSDEIKKEDKK